MLSLVPVQQRTVLPFTSAVKYGADACVREKTSTIVSSPRCCALHAATMTATTLHIIFCIRLLVFIAKLFRKIILYPKHERPGRRSGERRAIANRVTAGYMVRI